MQGIKLNIAGDGWGNAEWGNASPYGMAVPLLVVLTATTRIRWTANFKTTCQLLQYARFLHNIPTGGA